MMERKGYALPGPNTKGGELHGGPKRWTGRGPAPARHIPWPEIFKHHISLCEGHLKMVDMVRKHTVEGSGNHQTIMGCVERTQHLLNEAKFIARTFVPPKNYRDRVPLGSSSVSMYPGYSPADHAYGSAAQEYGKWAAEARKEGQDVKHPQAEYELGQAKGLKRTTLAAIREAKLAREGGSGSGTGSGSDAVSDSHSKKKTEHTAGPSQQASPPPEGDNPYFVVDTKPTPVNLPGMTQLPAKRGASPEEEPVESKKHKKAKRKHDGEIPKVEQGVEFEDISGEVDARLKAKEEKLKRKKEKKRKRESGEEPLVSGVLSTSTEKPKKKKHKDKEEEDLPDRTVSKKRTKAEVGKLEDGEGKTRNKRKKDADSEVDF